MADIEMTDALAPPSVDETSDPETTTQRQSASDSDDASQSDGEPFLAVSRSRRANAGNRMAKLLQLAEAEDETEEYGEIFHEFANDEEFHGEDDDGDVSLSSSDEDDAEEGQEEDSGEKELQKQEKAAERKKRKRETLLQQMMRKKAAKVMPAPAVQPVEVTPIQKQGPGRPRKKSERVSWLVNEEESGPVRASSRTLAMQSKEAVTERLKDREKQRTKTLAVMKAAEKRKEASKPKVLSQADRLAEAARIERQNSKTVSRWEEAERLRAEEQRLRLAALKNRRLDGPVISYYSGPALFLGDKLRAFGRKRVEKEMKRLQEEKDRPKVDEQEPEAQVGATDQVRTDMKTGPASQQDAEVIDSTATTSAGDQVIPASTMESVSGDKAPSLAESVTTKHPTTDIDVKKPSDPAAPETMASSQRPSPPHKTPSKERTVPTSLPPIDPTPSTAPATPSFASEISTPTSTIDPSTSDTSAAKPRWTPASMLTGSNPYLPKLSVAQPVTVSPAPQSPQVEPVKMTKIVFQPPILGEPVRGRQAPQAAMGSEGESAKVEEGLSAAQATFVDTTAIQPPTQSEQEMQPLTTTTNLGVDSNTSSSMQTVIQQTTSSPSTPLNLKDPIATTNPLQLPPTTHPLSQSQSIPHPSTTPAPLDNPLPPQPQPPPPEPSIHPLTLLTLNEFPFLTSTTTNTTTKRAADKEPLLIRALLSAPDFSAVKTRPVTKVTCSITGQPARYRDPKTGLAYADVKALKVVRRLAGFERVPKASTETQVRDEQSGQAVEISQEGLESGYVWSSLLGAYVGERGAKAARGVPVGFERPLSQEEVAELERKYQERVEMEKEKEQERLRVAAAKTPVPGVGPTDATNVGADVGTSISSTPKETIVLESAAQ